MIYPIWPAFVTQFLGANLTILGFIDGLGEALVSISKSLSGLLSDKIRKRKVFIWTGYLMGLLSRIGYALSKSWIWLIPFKVLDRSGKIRSAPRDALVAEVSVDTNRAKNFGLLRAMDHLGAVVGILLSLLLFKYLGYRKLFLIAAIPTFIAVLLVIFGIKETKKDFIKVKTDFKVKYLSKDYFLFLISSAIFSLGAFSYSFLLILSREKGYATINMPIFYLIFTIAATLFALPSGSLSDKVGRKFVIFIGYIVWILVCLASIYFPRGIGIIILFILYGMHKGILEPVQKAFVSELAPEKYKASAIGLYQMIIGLCALPASMIAGFLWDKFGLIYPFSLSILLTILSVIIVITIKEKRLSAE